MLCGRIGGAPLLWIWALWGCTSSEPVFHLGYFPNVSHAPAIVGVETGKFQDGLGKVALKTSTFNAGPSAVEALLSGALDASFLGPNPTINAYAKSDGKAVRVIAGSTSGGAYLVVSPDVVTPADLQGKTVASPQLGNTQDVALRHWLQKNSLQTTETGGDVRILPQENAMTLEAFRSGEIAGAWVPEPWASRLILEGGGHVLQDERLLWPDGKYVTTHLVIRTEVLRDRPAEVEGFLRGYLDTLEWMAANSDQAKESTNQGIGKITGKPLPTATLDAAWPHLEFTSDPLPESLRTSAQHAEDVGLLQLDGVDLDGLYDLTLLTRIQAE